MDFSFIDTLWIVSGLLLVSACGYLLIKFRVIGESFIPPLAKFVLYASQPMLMVSCFQRATLNSGSGRIILEIVLVSIFLYAFAFGTSCLLFSLEKDREKARVYLVSSMFGNVGFMGIPIIEALMPNNGAALLAVSTVLAVFNLIAFTLGVYIMTGDRKSISVKKALLNPTMIGLYIGMALFLGDVKIPTVLATPVAMLGNLCIPLSFIILGMRFALINPVTLFTSSRVYLSSLLKLAVLPLVMLLFLALVPVSETTRLVVFITSATPTASVVLMFGEVYRSSAASAGRCILLSTLLSVVTLPLLLLLV